VRVHDGGSVKGPAIIVRALSDEDRWCEKASLAHRGQRRWNGLWARAARLEKPKQVAGFLDNRSSSQQLLDQGQRSDVAGIPSLASGKPKTVRGSVVKGDAPEPRQGAQLRGRRV